VAASAYHELGGAEIMCLSLGYLESQTFSEIDPTKPEKGVTLKYTGNNQCPGSAGMEKYSVTLVFECDKAGAKMPPTAKAVYQNSLCDWTIKMTSFYGCPLPHGVRRDSSHTMGSGWSFITLWVDSA
jgi:hypothetical protein